MKAQVFLFIVSAAKVQLINNGSSFRKVKMSVNQRERERTKYGMVFKGTICKNRPPVKFILLLFFNFSFSPLPVVLFFHLDCAGVRC